MLLIYRICASSSQEILIAAPSPLPPVLKAAAILALIMVLVTWLVRGVTSAASLDPDVTSSSSALSAATPFTGLGQASGSSLDVGTLGECRAVGCASSSEAAHPYQALSIVLALALLGAAYLIKRLWTANKVRVTE